MSQKLAIAISGAVSLGSFESGVMYEVVEAIAQHNQHPETTEAQKIIIDVVTGASAGAMTAAILAQKLLFEADQLRSPYQNDIYRAWVEDADIRTLLQSENDDNPDMAILSSGFVKQVGNKYLLGRYSSPSPPSAQRHPAVADKIYLGIALSNLNGFDFKINLTNIQGQLNVEDAQKNFFTYTRHKDCYISQIQGNQQDDNHNLWELIKQIAIASGSFPFAFQVQEIARISSDSAYKGSEFYTEPEPGKEPNKKSFAYTDGGIFENEPLGMAISLAGMLDKSPGDDEKRFFLYVAPGPKSSVANKDFTAAQATYVNTARALAGSVFTQSRFQDWIQVSKNNQLVKDFDKQAWFLKDLLEERPEKYLEFEQVAEKLLQTLYKDKEQQKEVDNKRLKQQFKEEYQELANLKEHGEAVAVSWLKAVQVLEKAANLGSKELLVVYAITAKDGEIAGERLSAFGGFFDKEFRKYDYYVGRTKAINFLKELQEKNSQAKKERQLYLLNFEPGKNLHKPAVDLGAVDLNNVDRKLRKQVRNLLLERLGRIIDSIEKRPLIAGPLKFFVKRMADDKLDKLLKLS